MKTISAGNYPVIIGNESVVELNGFLSDKKYSSIFVLVDENTKKYCFPKIKKDAPALQKAKIISIKSGEKNKNIRTCEKIWNELSKQNADRKSLLLNLGGGVITDIGGFTASTFKRGIDFVNVPTTLLAQVDASVGGKTGIDFSDFKNQVGTFAFPKAVFIIPFVLKTLKQRQRISGFAEVIKHGLIADKKYWNQIRTSSPALLSGQKAPVDEEWERIISHSVEIKNKIVTADPYENGLRKALNFGHTIGHAIESAYLKTKSPFLHGEAIATGIICEAYLSHKCCGLPGEELNEIAACILSRFHLKKIKHPLKKLIRLMRQDKKNNNSEINFTLLKLIGKAEINNYCSKELIEESVYFFNTLFK